MLREGKYTPGQIDREWTRDMVEEFNRWLAQKGSTLRMPLPARRAGDSSLNAASHQFALTGCGKSLNRDDSPPQGLKPSLIFARLARR